MFSSANSAAVGGISLILTIFGLILTAGGFWLTLYQIKRAENVANATANAVSGLKLKIKYFDSSVDSSRVIKSLEGAIIHLRGKSWLNASYSLWDAQNLLNIVRKNIDQDDISRDLTEKNIREFLSFIQLLEEVADKGVVDFDAKGMVYSIRLQINVLEEVILAAQKDAQNV